MSRMERAKKKKMPKHQYYIYMSGGKTHTHMKIQKKVWKDNI